MPQRDRKGLLFYIGIRRNRLSYFLAQMAVVAALFSVFIVDALNLFFIVDTHTFYAVLFVISMLLTAQRFRDCDQSGWWAVALYVPYPVLAGYTYFPYNYILQDVTEFLYAIYGATVFFTQFGLLSTPGTKGPNFFGPDPLGRKAAKKKKSAKTKSG